MARIYIVQLAASRIVLRIEKGGVFIARRGIENQAVQVFDHARQDSPAPLIACPRKEACKDAISSAAGMPFPETSPIATPK